MDGFGPLDSHQLLIEAAVEIGEAVRVHAHLVQDGGVQALDVEGIFDGGAAQLVGPAHAHAALDAAAGQPHREAVGVVVAAGALFVFGGGLAAELAAPDHQGLLQQSPLLQVLQQAGDGLVGLEGVQIVVGLEVSVGVPVGVPMVAP